MQRKCNKNAMKMQRNCNENAMKMRQKCNDNDDDAIMSIFCSVYTVVAVAVKYDDFDNDDDIAMTMTTMMALQ